LAILERWQTVCKACGFEGTPRDYRRVIRGWSSWGGTTIRWGISRRVLRSSITCEISYPNARWSYSGCSVREVERLLATLDPIRYLPTLSSIIATVNTPGFGGAPGHCTLSRYFAGIGAAYDVVATRFPGATIWVHGKNIGGLGALYLAAMRSPRAIIVRSLVDVSGIAAARVGRFARQPRRDVDPFMLPRQDAPAATRARSRRRRSAWLA
jgi:hypothetical protein